MLICFVGICTLPLLRRVDIPTHFSRLTSLLRRHRHRMEETHRLQHQRDDRNRLLMNIMQIKRSVYSEMKQRANSSPSPHKSTSSNSNPFNPKTTIIPPTHIHVISHSSAAAIRSCGQFLQQEITILIVEQTAMEPADAAENSRGRVQEYEMQESMQIMRRFRGLC